jgi:hypothetical protein
LTFRLPSVVGLPSTVSTTSAGLDAFRIPCFHFRSILTLTPTDFSQAR